MSKPLPLDVAERARQKAQSRIADVESVTSGAKTRKQLAIENGAFAFPASRIRLDWSGFKKRSRRKLPG